MDKKREKDMLRDMLDHAETTILADAAAPEDLKAVVLAGKRVRELRDAMDALMPLYTKVAMECTERPEFVGALRDISNYAELARVGILQFVQEISREVGL